LNRLDQNFVAILNVLSLLREKPMTYDELLKSGYFKGKNQLNFALRRLNQAGCIDKIKAAGVYTILGHGITLLSFYPAWKPIPTEVLDVIQPIGDVSEENRPNMCRDRSSSIQQRGRLSLHYIKGYRCQHCGYEWVPRKGSKSPPKVCPKCKSPYWVNHENEKKLKLEEIWLAYLNEVLYALLFFMFLF
jgi:predicted Zn-ribbon and HTH transcriptional regulator